MKKYLIVFMSCVGVLGCLLPFLNQVKAKETEQSLVYVAIGDSIAVGYGLPSAKTSFVSQVAKALDTQASNLAVNGMNSSELLEAMKNEEMRNVLKQADVISVSIGSNDLLRPFTNLITSTLGSSLHNPSSLEDVEVMVQKFSKLTNALNSEETKTMFQMQIQLFEKNWQEIIAELKAIAPNAKILVNNFYNPFVETSLIGVPLGAYTEKYIPLMNEIVKKNVGLGYTMIDVYTPFQKQGLTNIDVRTMNYDPHPNQKGHDTIANLVKQTLNLPVSIPEPTVQIKKVKTVVNGKMRIFNQKSLRVDSKFHYVSADEIAKIIDAKQVIQWDKETVTFTKGKKEMMVKIGEKRAKINGKSVYLSMEVKQQGTHILVPVEAFTKAFEGSYKYDEETNTLTIRLKYV